MSGRGVCVHNGHHSADRIGVSLRLDGSLAAGRQVDRARAGQLHVRSRDDRRQILSRLDTGIRDDSAAQCSTGHKADFVVTHNVIQGSQSKRTGCGFQSGDGQLGAVTDV